MSKDSTPLSRRWLFRLVMAMMICLLLLARKMGYGQVDSSQSKQAILQGSIDIRPAKPSAYNQKERIQPGTSVQLSTVVENRGSQTSPPGKLYIRYAFPRPLDDEHASTIFETEAVPLPPIEPGKKVEINFNTPHQWPSLMDFIRYDWPMREYQAIAVFDGTEKPIGSLAITFSAYYYPGIRKEFPTPIATQLPMEEPLEAPAAR